MLFYIEFKSEGEHLPTGKMHVACMTTTVRAVSRKHAINKAMGFLLSGRVLPVHKDREDSPDWRCVANVEILD